MLDERIGLRKELFVSYKSSPNYIQKENSDDFRYG